MPCIEAHEHETCRAPGPHLMEATEEEIQILDLLIIEATNEDPGRLPVGPTEAHVDPTGVRAASDKLHVNPAQAQTGSPTPVGNETGPPEEAQDVAIAGVIDEDIHVEAGREQSISQQPGPSTVLMEGVIEEDTKTIARPSSRDVDMFAAVPLFVHAVQRVPQQMPRQLVQIIHHQPMHPHALQGHVWPQALHTPPAVVHSPNPFQPQPFAQAPMGLTAVQYQLPAAPVQHPAAPNQHARPPTPQPQWPDEAWHVRAAPSGLFGSPPPTPRMEQVWKYVYDFKTRCWTPVRTSVCIEPMPFSEGANRTAHYMTDQNGQMWVAKAHRTPAPKEDVFREVAMMALCQWFATHYNARNPPKRVTFVDAFVIGRDSGQYMACEEWMPGRFKKYNNNGGWRDLDRNTPHAFAHFTYAFSRGRCMVVDIQGVGDVYTDPQMHTMERRFGKGDYGHGGMQLFFSTHLCNPVCVGLGLSPFPTVCSGTQMPHRSASSASPPPSLPARDGGRAAVQACA